MKLFAYMLAFFSDPLPFIIMKVIEILIGIRVSPETEERGLDIEEHAEWAYTDEGEFGGTR
jgi:Amt family ammonium transporter